MVEFVGVDYALDAGDEVIAIGEGEGGGGDVVGVGEESELAVEFGGNDQDVGGGG